MGPIKPITGAVCVTANIVAAISALKTGYILFFRGAKRFACLLFCVALLLSLSI